MSESWYHPINPGQEWRWELALAYRRVKLIRRVLIGPAGLARGVLTRVRSSLALTTCVKIHWCWKVEEVPVDCGLCRKCHFCLDRVCQHRSFRIKHPSDSPNSTMRSYSTGPGLFGLRVRKDRSEGWRGLQNVILFVLIPRPWCWRTELPFVKKTSNAAHLTS